MNKALQYFEGNELAANVWASKYALKDKEQKQVEDSPDQMHRRMAKEFARIEAKHGDKGLSEDFIYNLFENFRKVIPQGSVMSQLGNSYQIGSVSNCIVLPRIHDSYGGILYSDQQLVQLMKRRCGVGADLSTLRPAGSVVSNAAQTSTGAVSFMHRFSNSTREVAQDGRRGALMLTLDIRHPEAEQFAVIKQDLTKVTGANISLKVVDEFMEAVVGKEEFTHRFPVYVPIEKAKYTKTVNANQLWDTIVGAAHKSAEPGVIYWDRQHYYSPSSLYPEFENIATNPCAEIAMGNDSCRLIAKNMFGCVDYPYTHSSSFDFDEWYAVSYNTMLLMDDLVDLELEKIEKILEKIDNDDEPDHVKAVERQTWEQLYTTGSRGRRTGSGFTAMADTLAALGIKYSSKEGIEMVERIMRVKLAAELDATIDMAVTRGAFPAFDAALEAKWAEDERTFFYMLKNEFPQQWARMQKEGRRNISWSTVAPTGSLSLLTSLSRRHFGSSSGIEPVFSIVYFRRKKINPNDKDARVDFVDDLGDKWQEFPVFHEGFKMWLEINYPDVIADSLTKKEIDEYVKLSPYYGATAPEIDWYQRVEMQGVIQKYITHSISSTINLPNTVTTDEVSNIYIEAWRQGLKGITVYRDGSRSGVLITEQVKKEDDFVYHDAPKRPKELEAEYYPVKVKGVSYAVIIGFLKGRPYEIFAYQDPMPSSNCRGHIWKMGKGKYDFTAENIHVDNINTQAAHVDEQMLTRLVSGMMRHGVNPKFIIEQIDKCPLEIVSFGSALKRIIKKTVPEKELLERHKCKDCGSSNIRFEEGCAKCLDCGQSRCG